MSISLLLKTISAIHSLTTLFIRWKPCLLLANEPTNSAPIPPMTQTEGVELFDAIKLLCATNGLCMKTAVSAVGVEPGPVALT